MTTAYQDSGFAYQGTGQFAYQTSLGTTTTPVTGGGWLFLNAYEAERARRARAARLRKKLEEETEQIEVDLDRNIAQLLREQEAQDERRKDLERLGDIAKQHADLEAARQYSDRVAVAYSRALVQGNYSALEALDRELQRAADEEEFLLMAMMMLDEQN